MTKKKKKNKEWNEAIDDLENYEHEDIVKIKQIVFICFII